MRDRQIGQHVRIADPAHEVVKLSLKRKTLEDGRIRVTGEFIDCTGLENVGQVRHAVLEG